MLGTRLQRWRATFLIALCVSTAGSCTRQENPNVLFVVIDTLRADSLGCYGSGEGLTPFLDSLAERGFVFRNAYSTSPWTKPAVASLLTSLYPSQHGATTFQARLGTDAITLPELLKDHGYRTGAFSANGLITKTHGYDQGFDEYQVKPQRGAGPANLRQKVRADEINSDALSWLDQSPRNTPKFLYLHYLEPHTPYQPSKEIVRRVFPDRRPDLKLLSTAALGQFEYAIDQAKLRDLKKAYAAEIISVDQSLKSLFAEIEKRGFLDNALVVITSDHGEAFFEHNLIGHGHDLYDSVLRIPLIVLAPGRSDHVEVSDVVSLIDLAPTVLELLGTPAPSAFQGRSLHSVLSGMQLPGSLASSAADQQRPVYAELVELPGPKTVRFSPHNRAVIQGSGKLITGINGEREFYDLSEDPAESGRARLGESERAILEAALARFARRPPLTHQQAPAPIDEDTREQMRALGYAE